MCVYVCVYVCVCVCVCVCGKDDYLLMSYAKRLRESLVPELSRQISVISVYTTTLSF
jgi:hypothetical protein